MPEGKENARLLQRYKHCHQDQVYDPMDSIVLHSTTLHPCQLPTVASLVISVFLVSLLASVCGMKNSWSPQNTVKEQPSRGAGEEISTSTYLGARLT